RSGLRAPARRRPRRSPSPRAWPGTAWSACRSEGRSPRRTITAAPVQRAHGSRPRLSDVAAGAVLSRDAGLGMGGPRRVVVRGDDERSGAGARAARGACALLDARPPARGPVARRDGEGALPDLRGPPPRGGAHAVSRRAPLGLRLVAVGLPAHLHVLRHRPDAPSPQPDGVGEPRPGAPTQPPGARRPPL